ncbi:MAG TPA: hypothetical protein VEY89_10160, partial [Candidatus Dormibacteraeota bacterium]|nr:hypothetical protein [Candidatus Dormibacteraeota bacterium]
MATTLAGCGGGSGSAPTATAPSTSTSSAPAPSNPPATPPASPPATGSISPNALWACNFPHAPTDCGLSEQTAAPDRAKIVSPGRAGPTALELTTQPGDANIDGSGTSERADLELPANSSYCNQGQEEWWAHSLMFPSSYTVPPAGSTWNWGVVFDFHH